MLVVALNSDASVRGLKGEGRPVVPGGASGRRSLLALEAVDRVVLYDEPTPIEVDPGPPARRPGEGRGLGRGRDRRGPGGRGGGGRVVRVDLVPGRSTSALVDRIRRP